MTELILTEQETGEETLIQMGPHHPSTHGVINFLLRSQGELVRLATPNVGYLHRGIEKLAEITPYAGFMPYTDRVDYLAAMFANQGFAMAVEGLAGIVPPRRAEYLRVIATELNRIASHLIAVGSMAMDMGAFTPFVHGLREREVINDLIERLCGARLTYHYVRIGGVARDLDAALARDMLAFCDRFERFLPEYDRLISGNEIFVKRLADVGVISAADAISFGLAGPNLRASGVDYDLRRDAPYGAYPELAFAVPLGRGTRGTVGDCYDRFVVRVDEMAASIQLVRQALLGLPEGAYTAEVPRRLKPPPGEFYARVESARGELGYFVISNGSEQPERVKIRCGSFTALSIVEHVSPGLMLGDFVALIASLDVVAPEIDR